jgi:hypothetical protein
VDTPAAGQDADLRHRTAESARVLAGGRRAPRRAEEQLVVLAASHRERERIEAELRGGGSEPACQRQALGRDVRGETALARYVAEVLPEPVREVDRRSRESRPRERRSGGNGRVRTELSPCEPALGRSRGARSLEQRQPGRRAAELAGDEEAVTESAGASAHGRSRPSRRP